MDVEVKPPIDSIDEFIVRYEEKDRKKVFAAARRLGCKVIVADSNQLQIDLDEPWVFSVDYLKSTKSKIHDKAQELFDEKVWWSFDREVNVIILEAWRSRNGNTHIVLTLDRDYTPFERIIFQAVLGSDPVRELLNWKRVVDGSDNPIALFKPRYGKEE